MEQARDIRLKRRWSVLVKPDHLIGANARTHIGRCAAQCALATGVIGAILLFLDTLLHAEIIATLGATTFILFALPTSHAARPSALLGGYAWGLLTGMLCCLLADRLPFQEIALSSRAQDILFGALAVGLAIFGMVITHMEHPPAAGVALSLVVRPWGINTLLFVVVAVLLLAAAHCALRRILVDLA